MIRKDFREDFLKNSKIKDGLCIFLSNKVGFHKTLQVLVVRIKDTVAINKNEIATENLIFNCLD